MAISEYMGTTEYKGVLIPVYSSVISGGKRISFIPYDQINAGINLINSFSVTINKNAINENEILRSSGIIDYFLKLQSDYNTIMNSVNSGDIRTIINYTFNEGTGLNYAEAAYILKTKYNVSTFTELFEKLKYQLDSDKQIVIEKINELYYTEPIIPQTLSEELKYGINSVKYVSKEPEKESSNNVKNIFSPAVLITAGIITALTIWRFKK